MSLGDGPDITAHEMSIDELVKMLGTNIENGLTREQAKENLKKHGPNLIKEEDINDPQSPHRNYAVVRRDGEKLDIKVADLTIGDIVELKAGHVVPGDIRIVESDGLATDMSALTGSSGPQPRSTGNTSDNPLETANLAFYRDRVVEGTGVGVVFMVGQKTVYGKIAHLSSPFPGDSGSSKCTLL